MLMDAVFGPKRLLNEVVWVRSSAHSDSKQGMMRCGRIHDILLVYANGDDHTWNTVYTPYDEAYLESEYRHKTSGGRYYKETDLTAAKPGGDVEYEWRVKRRAVEDARWEADLESEHKTPKAGWDYKGVFPYEGRFWAYSRANLAEFARKGDLIHRKTGMPRLMQFADTMPGVPLQDVWTDISPASGDEDLGYPTQKPRELLKRIVTVSSNAGATVLDPFCGCGTAVEAAQELHRPWIGIDITHLAINLIKKRLSDAFGEAIKDTYETIGEPTSVDDAAALAASDPYQFQWWALSLVGARPAEQKKGKDRGIDGRIYFHDDTSGDTKSVILSVKAGHTGPDHVRDLRGTVEREKAAIGVLITMDKPTAEMRKEAATGEFYLSQWGQHAKIQLLTVADLLAGKQINRPPDRQTGATFKKAPKAKGQTKKTQKLGFDD
jgi:hypothetical protein